MILVWGIGQDHPVSAVNAALQRLGESVLFFDQRESPGVELDLCTDSEINGVLRLPGCDVNLESIKGAYLRPYGSWRLHDTAQELPDLRARLTALDEGLLCWSEVASGRIVNRPFAMASNHSKPYQSALILAQGFDVPETLVTTDWLALEAFWEQHREIVYKSISGVRSIVTRLTPRHRERFGDLPNCPTQFQQWIPGIDIRVHVAGDDVFACTVASSAIDYRYPHDEEERPVIGTYDLPIDLADRCRQLVTSLSLEVAGIDFRLTPEGQWFCFEVNPSPGFTYYEQATRQPIADSIARLLASS
ncbi:MAG: RimK family alpha-L-glutamate ligase [Bryobacteraceae bacterium]